MNIFFDLDGTLIDSRKRLYKLFNDLTNNKLLSFKDYWELKKLRYSNQWILENYTCFNKINYSEFENLWMQKIESDNYLKFDKTFDFTSTTLQRLKTNNQLFLVTARQDKKQLDKQLINLKIKDFFKTIVVTEQKESKLNLINNLNLQLKKTDLFIGDTGEDIQTAKKLNITSIGVTSGFRSSSILKLYQPDKIIHNISKINLS